MFEQEWKSRVPEKGLVFLFFSVLFGTWILQIVNASIFQRFLGPIPPVHIVFCTLLVGYVVLVFYLKPKGFPIAHRDSLSGVVSSLWLLGLFLTVSILVDIRMIFPKDMNIPFPESLLFYPVIACFVEVLFHVLPMGLLLFLLTTVFKKAHSKTLIWVIILMVSLLEPTYQITLDLYPTWAAIVIWVNLFLFDVNQLVMFKNHGFLAMFSFRLLYYLGWHIIWGMIRLEYLF